nr:phage terminase small subunit P27 family [Bradyrhizobium sp. 2S1]MCK7667582.1 phage terminase small subunit P27 family [Bradyrhizobium sp. 2S1]
MPNPPMPFALRVLRGNPGKRPLRSEPQPTRPPTCPEPPQFIVGYAADEWRRVAPELHALGLLTRIDVPALAAYCVSYAGWRQAAELLARMAVNDPMTSGQLIKTKYGDARQNPLVSIARKYAADMVRFASEFGLTALARTRISADPNAPQPPRKFDGLLR